MRIGRETGRKEQRKKVLNEGRKETSGNRKGKEKKWKIWKARDKKRNQGTIE